MEAEPLRADAARNRQALLSAAQQLMSEQGLDAPLDEIARRAGVGNATLYRRFPTRTDLIVAVCEERMAEHVRAVEEALAEPDSWEAFVHYITAAGALQARDRAIADLVTLDVSSAPEIEQLRVRTRCVGSRPSSSGRRPPAPSAPTAPRRTCSSCCSRMRASSSDRRGQQLRRRNGSCTCFSTGCAPTRPLTVPFRRHHAASAPPSASAVATSALTCRREKHDRCGGFAGVIEEATDTDTRRCALTSMGVTAVYDPGATRSALASTPLLQQRVRRGVQEPMYTGPVLRGELVLENTLGPSRARRSQPDGDDA